MPEETVALYTRLLLPTCVICLYSSLLKPDLVESQAKKENGCVTSWDGERRRLERGFLSLVAAQELEPRGRKASERTSCVMMSEAQGKGAPGTEGNTPEVTAAHMSSSTQQVQGGASVSSPVASIQPPATTATEDEDESEDECEILEESPCGRWQKRREEVREEGGTGSCALMVSSENVCLTV